jgi:hypothetical protein
MDILRVGSAIALSMFLAGTAFGRNSSHSAAAVLAYGPYGHLNSGWFPHRYGYHPFAYGYGQSSYFPYLYFFDHYAREAEESRRAADEYEASLAREGKLTGPEKVGAFPTDYLPFPPPGVTLIFDGDEQDASPSGAALVIESGEHSLRIAAKPPVGNAAPSLD